MSLCGGQGASYDLHLMRRGGLGLGMVVFFHGCVVWLFGNAKAGIHHKLPCCFLLELKRDVLEYLVTFVVLPQRLLRIVRAKSCFLVVDEAEGNGVSNFSGNAAPVNFRSHCINKP